jgi:uncharacterized membrane protein
MSGTEIVFALAFVAFVHAAAGAIGAFAMAYAAFRRAVDLEGGAIAGYIKARRTHLPPEAYEPPGWLFLALTPFVLALIRLPAWLRPQGYHSSASPAREFVRQRKLLALFAIVAVTAAGAAWETAPPIG